MIFKRKVWLAFAYLLAAAVLSACTSTPGRDQALGMVVTTAFSPNGKLIAASTSDGEVALFSTQPLWFRRLLSRESDRSPTPHGYDEMIGSVYRPLPLAFSRDGTLLAAGGVGGSVVVWDVTSGSERLRVPARGKILDIVFIPDGEALVTAGPDVAILSTRNGEQIGELPLPAGTAATAAAVSPDGHVVVVGLSTGEIATFDAGSRTPLDKSKAHEVPVTGLAFGADRAAIASTAGGYDLRLWKLNLMGGLDQREASLAAAASASASITQAQGFGVLLWLLGTIRGVQIVGAPTMSAPPFLAGAAGQFAKAARTIPHHCGSRVAFSANGRYLAATANLMTCAGCMGTLAPAFMLFVSNLETGATATARDRGCAVAVSPDGRIVAVGGAGAPELLDSMTGDRIAEVPGRN